MWFLNTLRLLFPRWAWQPVCSGGKLLRSWSSLIQIQRLQFLKSANINEASFVWIHLNSQSICFCWQCLNRFHQICNYYEVFINTENYKEWYIKNSLKYLPDFLNITFSLLDADLFSKEIKYYRYSWTFIIALSNYEHNYRNYLSLSIFSTFISIMLRVSCICNSSIILHMFL